MVFKTTDPFMLSVNNGLQRFRKWGQSNPSYQMTAPYAHQCPGDLNVHVIKALVVILC